MFDQHTQENTDFKKVGNIGKQWKKWEIVKENFNLLGKMCAESREVDKSI